MPPRGRTPQQDDIDGHEDGNSEEAQQSAPLQARAGQPGKGRLELRLVLQCLRAEKDLSGLFEGAVAVYGLGCPVVRRLRVFLSVEGTERRLYIINRPPLRSSDSRLSPVYTGPMLPRLLPDGNRHR